MHFKVLKLVGDIFELGRVDEPLEVCKEIFHASGPGLIFRWPVLDFKASNCGAIVFNLMRMLLEGVVVSVVLTVLQEFVDVKVQGTLLQKNKLDKVVEGPHKHFEAGVGNLCSTEVKFVLFSVFWVLLAI